MLVVIHFIIYLFCIFGVECLSAKGLARQCQGVRQKSARVVGTEMLCLSARGGGTELLYLSARGCGTEWLSCQGSGTEWFPDKCLSARGLGTREK